MDAVLWSHYYDEEHLLTQRATARYVKPVIKMASSVPLGIAELGF